MSDEIEVLAPIPSILVKLLVTEGQTVNEGDPLLILESMKMENEIVAPNSGTVTFLNKKIGNLVEQDEILAKIKNNV